MEASSSGTKDSGSASSTSCGRIVTAIHLSNRLDLESRTQDFRRAVHIGHVDFHLLNSLAKFIEKARNCAVAARRLRCEDVQARSWYEASREFKLELEDVLVGRSVGERRRAVGRTNLIEGFR